MTLGRKARLDAQEPWLRAAASALATVDPAQLAAKCDGIIREARALQAGGARLGYGWSGGKDSQALRWLMEQAGVERSVLGVTRDMEFPAMRRWLIRHMPAGCDLLDHPRITLRWLAARPELLFPRGDAQEWFDVNRRAWRQFIHYERLTVLILGRRRLDGNYVGPNGADRYTDRGGVVRWSPLGDWTHEEVFALIARERLPLPPCYDWPRGYRTGTGAWPSRDPAGDTTYRTDPAKQLALDYAQGFAECWEIDPDVIRAAGPDLPAAAAWMRAHGKD